MPLTMARIGDQISIKRITGKDETRKFLERLGFVEGEAVTIVSIIGGNMILNVKNTRVALDEKMARRIMV
ncbi:MAG: ferrous iron transport protein A [Clostridiales bacterium]|jgi:ferrous iron transport protein A|nr:ferrous iron transport protein A [Clostridiales bacterium]